MNIKQTTPNDKLILRATYLAMGVSIILAIVKFGNYFLTGSVAIHASALDSLMDICVSFANFIAIKLTMRKANSKFPYGYDKIAALMAFVQVILITFLAWHLIHECIERLTEQEHMHDFGWAFTIIGFSILLNSFLVWYQSMVIKKTGSLVIKADMIHYKTDFFTNIAIFLGILSVMLFDIHWLDPLIGAAAAIYLLFAIWSLLKSALASLLDTNNEDFAKTIVNYLNENGVQIKNESVRVLFSGTRNKIQIVFDEKTLSQDKIRSLIQEKYDNSTTEFVLQ